MFFSKRSDGELVKDASQLRKMMPYIMPKRVDALVYFEQALEVEQLQQYLKTRTQKTGVDVTFFHAMLACMARAVLVRPQMNRFVFGKRLYQRKDAVIAFAVKKEKTDEAGMTTVKATLTAQDSLDDIARKIDTAIAQGRSKKLTASEKEIKLVHWLPGFIKNFLIGAHQWLDQMGFLPASATRQDPLYSSVFVANLGSIGLTAPFHHLYEYGTTSIFAVIGKVQKEPVVAENGEIVARDIVRVRYSFDERIADGFYAGRSLQLLEGFLKDPSVLEKPVSVVESSAKLPAQIGDFFPDRQAAAE